MKSQALIIVVLVAGSIGFGSGWLVNGWRLEAIFAEAQVAAIEQYDALQKKANERYVALEREAMEQRVRLSKELSNSRAIAADLEDQLDSANLVAEAPNIEEVVINGSEDCQAPVVVANPIGDEFIQLWNDSAGGGGTDGAGED